MRAVKSRMYMDGHEPDELDDFQYKRVRFLSASERPQGWSEIWEGPHAKVRVCAPFVLPLQKTPQQLTLAVACIVLQNAQHWCSR